MTRALRVFLYGMIFSASCTGCQRSDRPAPSEPLRESVTAAAAAPSVAHADNSPRCLVPLPQTGLPPTPRASSCPAAPNIALPLTRRKIAVVGAVPNVVIDAEIASNTEDQQRGLMYRTSLGDDAGMLFTWPNEQIRTFWMHNTCVPLDMLFIAKDGTIAGILEQVPVLNDEPRSVNCPATAVLEVNAGYCREHGIAPGQKIRLLD